MKTVSFITTSKGRLHHIKQTLPLMVMQDPAEVIVVDYNCPDRTGHWVEANFPDVKVVRINDDSGFCLSRARNLGAKHAGSDWLVFIDDDVKVAPGWGAWMQQHLNAGHYYRAARKSRMRNLETYGTVICAQSDFEAIGGYDEAFKGWGGEDYDLFGRLKHHGIVEQDYPSEFVTAISHGDENRAGWAGMQNKEQHLAVIKCYIAAKTQLAMLMDGSKDLPYERRIKLMEYTKKILTKWYREGASEPLNIPYVFNRSGPRWLSRLNVMETKLTFTIRVRSRSRQ